MSKIEQGEGEIIRYIKYKYETPLLMLDRLRKERPELQGVKLSYLGRLDPLAHGVMLVATGEANKQREKYLQLDKTYRVQFLCGISTDTGDMLGKITDISKERIIDADVPFSINTLVGRHVLPYPLYSSKTVKGKPLHEYGREGKRVERPQREMNVSAVEFISQEFVLGKNVASQAIEATERVHGDFRQEDIRDLWETFLLEYREHAFLILTVKLHVSSGTYIRALASCLGEKLQIPVLAYDIERTEIHSRL